MSYRTSLIVICAIAFLPAALLPLSQEAHAGTVFKRQCPYSCKTVGVPKSHCKDWKEKKRCAVEIMPGAKSSSNYTFKKKCPLSCKSMGVPKSRCKDWKEGDKCLVKM